VDSGYGITRGLLCEKPDQTTDADKIEVSAVYSVNAGGRFPFLSWSVLVPFACVFLASCQSDGIFHIPAALTLPDTPAALQEQSSDSSQEQEQRPGTTDTNLQPQESADNAQTPCACDLNESGEKAVAGAVELLSFPGPGNLVLEARVDTGAKTSSLHVSTWKEFERDGARWVSFTLPTVSGKDTGDLLTLERPLSRVVLIKGREKENQRRPVVQMKVRLGEIERRIEFTLADRSDFEFPALLGRNFLLDTVVVDVSSRFLLSGPPSTKTPGPSRQSSSQNRNAP